MSTSQVEAKDVVIVIPFHKPQLNATERRVLQQCTKILGKYDVTFVHPTAVDISLHREVIPQARSAPCGDKYLGQLSGYNKLFIGDFFYEQFSSYKYMLIYHLDAWVFHDSLLEWCNKGYDCIGAPWLEEPTPKKKSRIFNFTRLCVNQVGNGGFCLRNVSTHIRIAKLLKPLLRFYHYNEDVLWSVFVPWVFWSYKRPKWKEAMEFAFEYSPRKSYQMIGNKLPFGTHGWERTDREFWNQFIHLNE